MPRSSRMTLSLVVALTGLALCKPALSAQEVAIPPWGWGFKPEGLKMGSRLAPGTVVEADSESILVIKNSWEFGEATCEERVVIRNRKHTVKAATPGSCQEVGVGDEVARAMRRESAGG